MACFIFPDPLHYGHCWISWFFIVRWPLPKQRKHSRSWRSSCAGLAAATWALMMVASTFFGWSPMFCILLSTTFLIGLCKGMSKALYTFLWLPGVCAFNPSYNSLAFCSSNDSSIFFATYGEGASLLTFEIALFLVGIYPWPNSLLMFERPRSLMGRTSCLSAYSENLRSSANIGGPWGIVVNYLRNIGLFNCEDLAVAASIYSYYWAAKPGRN